MFNPKEIFHRRGWAFVRFMVVAAYIGRAGGFVSVETLRFLGFNSALDYKHLPAAMSYPIAGVSIILGHMLLKFLGSLKLKQLLQRGDLPKVLHPIEMMWFKGIREEVWRPSYFDEQALYFEQPAKSSRQIKNFLFMVRVLLLAIETSRMGIMRVFRSLPAWKWHR